MKLRRLIACLCCCVWPAAACAAAPPEFQIQRADAAGFEFVYQVPALGLAPDTVNSRAYVRLTVPGAGNHGLPGEPSLPVRTVLVGVPYGARVDVQVEAAGPVRALAGIPLPHPWPGAPGNPQVAALAPLRRDASPQAYAQTRYAPAVLGRLTGMLQIRNQRLARIELYPVQAAPGLGQMRAQGALRVRVSWTGGRTGTPAEVQDPFESVYRRRVLNYEAARAFRRPAAPRVDNPLDGSNFFSASTGPWLRLRLSQRGIYEIGNAELVAAGLSAAQIAAIDPTTFRVFTSTTGGTPLDENEDCDTCFMREVDCDVRDAQDVPITVSRGHQAGDKVVFYAAGTQGYPEEYAADTTATDSTTAYLHNPYTDQNVYWLTWGAGSRFGSAPHRMVRVASPPRAGANAVYSGVPARLHFEQAVIYDPDLAGQSRESPLWERWWWEEYDNRQYNPASGPQPYLLPAVPFALPAADTSQPALVTLRLWGTRQGANTYHHLLLSNALSGEAVTGLALLDSSWQGVNQRDLTGTFRVRPDGNQFILTILTPRDANSVAPPDQIRLGFFDVLYRRTLLAVSGAAFFRAPDSVGTLGYELQGFTAAREVYSMRNFGSAVRITGGDAGFFAESGAGRTAYEVLEPGAHLHPAVELAPYLGRSGSGWAYLKDTGRGADDVIVSYDGFLSLAGELATWRSSHLQGFSSPRVAVVGIQQVYDEFSGGRFDPTALRNFGRYAFRNWSGSPLSYLTLLGDASEDFKDYGKRSPNGDGITNFVPAYENSYDWEFNFSTDDWFTQVLPEFGMAYTIGRLPADNLDQARLLVRDKTIAYEQNPEYGVWRDRVVLGADDLYLCSAPDDLGWQHTQSAEEMARFYYPYELDVRRVYLVEYPYGVTGDLCNKPGAEHDYLEGMNQGAIMVGFVGHGNADQIANEKLFSVTDLGSVQNHRRLWWFMMASCIVGKVDAYDRDGLAESVMKLRQGGAVVALAATQQADAYENVYLQDSILVHLFDRSDGALGHPVGLAVLVGKTSYPSTYNNPKYLLQGDPALLLGAPANQVRLEGFPDTVRQGQFVQVQYKVYRGWNGTQVATDFNGSDSVEVSEPPIDKVIHPDYGVGYDQFMVGDYLLPTGTIYRGVGTIRNGVGQVSFWVPAAGRRGARARVRVYAMGQVASATPTDASGADSFVVVSGTPAVDDSGPTLTVTVEGDLKDVKPGTAVHITASSPHGIYLGQQPLNSVYLAIDNSTQHVILNDRFTYRLDSSTEGSVDYPMPALDPGQHTLLVSASSNLASSIEAGRHRKTVTLNFAVAGGPAPELRNVFNYPNPVRSSATDLYFESWEPGQASVAILTVAGRTIRTLRTSMVTGQNRVGWDLRDEDGDVVANGAYLFRVEAHGADGQVSKAVGKIVVLRN